MVYYRATGRVNIRSGAPWAADARRAARGSRVHDAATDRGATRFLHTGSVRSRMQACRSRSRFATCRTKSATSSRLAPHAQVCRSRPICERNSSRRRRARMSTACSSVRASVSNGRAVAFRPRRSSLTSPRSAPEPRRRRLGRHGRPRGRGCGRSVERGGERDRCPRRASHRHGDAGPRGPSRSARRLPAVRTVRRALSRSRPASCAPRRRRGPGSRPGRGRPTAPSAGRAPPRAPARSGRAPSSGWRWRCRPAG